jgi:hypothetical protein
MTFAQDAQVFLEQVLLPRRYRRTPKPLGSLPPFAVVSNTCLHSKAKDCGLHNGQP